LLYFEKQKCKAQGRRFEMPFLVFLGTWKDISSVPPTEKFKIPSNDVFKHSVC